MLSKVGEEEIENLSETRKSDVFLGDIPGIIEKGKRFWLSK